MPLVKVLSSWGLRSSPSQSSKLGVRGRGPVPPPLLGSGTQVCWLWRKQNHVMVSDSKHRWNIMKQSPVLPGYCPQTGTITKSTASHSAFRLDQPLLGDGICSKSSEFHGPEPTLLHFCGSGMNSWVRSNAVWNTVMLDKAPVSV